MQSLKPGRTSMMMRHSLAVVVIGLTWALTMAWPAFAERRIALVIGNSEYQSAPKLANPANDARALSSTLTKLGFDQVTTKLDLGHEHLRSALHDFSRESVKADWAVVYYAGHGMQVGGINYMIPIDARLANDRDIEFEAVDADKALKAVDGAGRLKIVILDACRDNPLANRMKRTIASRSIGRGLGAVEPDAGTLVVYSARDGQLAQDGDGTNSPFLTSLLGRMQTPNLEVRRLFDLVRDDVMEQTGRQQMPFTYGSLPGKEDYYFLRTAAVAPTPAPIPAPAPSPLQPPPQLDQKELARALQVELARVGCDPGTPDGVWGPASQQAMRTYNKSASIQLEASVATMVALADVRTRSKRICAVTCRVGYRIDGETCVAIVCPSGQVANAAGACFTPAPAPVKRNCVMFNGTQYCD